MLRDITLGQYYQAESCIHRMDPRFKLIATVLFIVSLFIFTNPYVYSLAAIFMLFFIALSKVPIKHILKGMRAIVAILLMTVFFNMFFGEGEPIFSLWIFKLTWEGIERAIYMGIRLIMLIMGSSIMTYTTTPSQLTDGLENLLRPLRIFKVPVHEVSMMMSIALRFIPILMEETDIIMKAQLSRGADFESGNIIKKTKSLVPVLIPLFISAFRRASDMALAMEARCYRGGEGRTKMKPLRYTIVDVIGFIVVLIYIILIIFLGIYNSRISNLLTSFFSM